MEENEKELLRKFRCIDVNNLYYNPKFDPNKRYSITFKIIIALFVLCGYLGYKAYYSNKMIEKNHYQKINETQVHIAGAVDSIQFVKLYWNQKDYTISFLIEAKLQLENARQSIRGYSSYFNYKNKFSTTIHLGNSYASSYFLPHISLINNWIHNIAIDGDEKPTIEEIELYLKDLLDLANAFQVYIDVDYSNQKPIEKYNYDDFKELFHDLAKESETIFLNDYYNTHYND